MKHFGSSLAVQCAVTACVIASASALVWSAQVAAPLTYGSIVTLRIGAGNQVSTYGNTQQVYLDEWLMPTAQGVNATLLQTITPPGYCSSFATSSTTTYPAHGPLTRSADGTHLVFLCINVTALSGKSNTVPNAGGGETGWMIGQLYPSGQVNLISAAPSPGNSAYEALGVCSFNSSASYMSVIGGSQNGNNIYYANINSATLTTTSFIKIGVSGSTTMNWAGARGLACSPTGWGIYFGWEPATSIVTVAGVNFTGGMVQWPGYPTTAGVQTLLTPALYNRLVVPTILPVPRSFLVIPASGSPTALATTVWAVDYTLGLVRYTQNGTAANTYSMVGPFSVAGDTGYQGVALSADNTTLYVSANKGLYAFSAASLSWLQTTPVAQSVSAAAGQQAFFRGVALSVARPSSSPTSAASITSTATPVSTPSGSPSPSQTTTPTASGTLPSQTATGTASASLSAGASPSNSASASASFTGTTTSTQSLTPTKSATWTSTPTPTTTATSSATATPSALPAPLTVGSTLILRIGQGTFALTSQAQQSTYIEEWMLPLAPMGGNPVLLQTLAIPGPCTNIAGNVSEGAFTPAPAAQGFLSKSGDGSFLLFSCANANVGAGSQSAFQAGIISLSGSVSLIPMASNAGNAAYQYTSLVAFNPTTFYAAVVGGSVNGNGIRRCILSGGVCTWTSTSVTGTTGLAASSIGWNGLRGLYAQTTWAGASSLYVGYAGATNAGTPAACSSSFFGLNVWPGQPSSGMDGCSYSSYSKLSGVPALVDPRGFLVVPPAPPATVSSVVWATEYSFGIYVFTSNGTSTWSSTGPFSIAGETAYGGVALSSDGSTAYVTASRGVYVFDVAAMGWLSTAPLIAPPSQGFGLSAIYRGIVASPAFQSPRVVAQWDFADVSLGATSGVGATAVVGVGAVAGSALAYASDVYQFGPGSLQINASAVLPETGNSTSGIQACVTTAASGASPGFSAPLSFGFYARYDTGAINNWLVQWSASGPFGPWISIGNAPLSFAAYGIAANAANGAWLYSGNLSIPYASAGNNPNFCVQIVAAYAPGTSTYSQFGGGAYTSSGGQINFDTLTLYGVANPASPTMTPTVSSSAASTSSTTPSATLSVGATPSNSPTSTASPSASPSSTASQSATPTRTRSSSGTMTPPRTPSPTPTPTPSQQGPLSVGSVLIARLGDGTTSPTAVTNANFFIDEWMLPTVAGGSAYKLQTIAMPSTCTGIPGNLAGSAPATQGFLSSSADGSFVQWHCSTSAAGSGRGSIFSLGTMGTDGSVALTVGTGNQNTNSAYQYASWAALTSSAMFFSEIGGSSNGNGLYAFTGVTTNTYSTLVAQGTATTQFSGAIGAGYASLRNLYVQYTSKGVPVLYIAYAGSSSPGGAANTVFKGINQFNLTATWLAGVRIDPYNPSQYVSLTPALAEPRGFVPRQPVAPYTLPDTLFATELSTGLYKYSLDPATGALLAAQGPFAVGDSLYGGVALSADWSTAYLTAVGGVYAFDATLLTFLNGGAPIVPALSTGTGLSSVYRGIVMSITSPTPSHTMTASKSPTASPSTTQTSTSSPSNSKSATTSSSVTPSASQTAAGTPSVTASTSATISAGATATSTNSRSPSNTASPSTTASSSATKSPSTTGSATVTGTNTPSVSNTPSSSPTTTRTNTPTVTRTPATTRSPTQTPTPTSSARNLPLTYGSIVVLRIGAGATSNTSTTVAQVYLDEYSIPTTGASGTLLQTLALPSTCTLVPSTTSQGALTRSGDGRLLVFTCFNVAVGGAYTAAQYAFVDGAGDVTSFASLPANTPYYPASAAAINATFAYFTITGGANGNTIALLAPRGISTSVSGALAQTNYGSFSAALGARGGVYLAFASTATSGSNTLAGINYYTGVPGLTSPFDPFAGVQITTATTAPRGFTVSTAGIVYASDLALGLFKITPTGASTFATAGPYAVAGEAGYSGVALASNERVAFITASHGIYGFDVTSLTWLSSTPLVAAPGSGATQAVFRGIALSPVSPSPTSTPSSTSTRTPSASNTPSASQSFGTSPSSAPTTTPSSSNTPSSSMTISLTSSPSSTHTATPSRTATPSLTPTRTATPSASAFVVAQWDVSSASLAANLGNAGPLVGTGGVSLAYSTSNYQTTPGSMVIGPSVTWPAQGTANGTAGVQFCASTVGYTSPLEVSFYFRYTPSAVTNLQLQWSASGATGPWTSIGGPLYYGGGTNAASGAWQYSGYSVISSAAAAGNDAFCAQLVLVFAPGTSTYVLQNGGAYSTSGGQLNFDVITVFGVPVTPTASSSASNTGTPASTPSSTRSTTRSVTPSRTNSGTGSRTGAQTSTKSPSSSSSASASASSTAATTPSPTRSVTRTMTPSRSAAVSSTGSGSTTAVASSTSSRTSSPSASSSASGSSSESATPPPSKSPTRTAARTRTPVPTTSTTAAPSPTSTLSAASTPQSTVTPPVTPTASLVAPSQSSTPASTTTRTPTSTLTPTRTPTVSQTGTKTPTATITSSKTPTRSRTGSKTATASKTASKTATKSKTGSRTVSSSRKAKL